MSGQVLSGHFYGFRKSLLDFSPSSPCKLRNFNGFMSVDYESVLFQLIYIFVFGRRKERSLISIFQNYATITIYWHYCDLAWLCKASLIINTIISGDLFE